MVGLLNLQPFVAHARLRDPSCLAARGTGRWKAGRVTKRTFTLQLEEEWIKAQFRKLGRAIEWKKSFRAAAPRLFMSLARMKCN